MHSSQLIIGFDFGLRRIGVAVGNHHTQKARPLPTLLAKQGEPDWPQVARCIKDWRPACLVVGLPTHINNSEQYITRAARAFANRLEEKFNLPVHLVDERLSTVEARTQLFDAGGYQNIRKSEVDSVAACVILEQWLRTDKTQ